MKNNFNFTKKSFSCLSIKFDIFKNLIFKSLILRKISFFNSNIHPKYIVFKNSISLTNFFSMKSLYKSNFGEISGL